MPRPPTPQHLPLDKVVVTGIYGADTTLQCKSEWTYAFGLSNNPTEQGLSEMKNGYTQTNYLSGVGKGPAQVRLGLNIVLSLHLADLRLCMVPRTIIIPKGASGLGGSLQEYTGLLHDRLKESTKGCHGCEKREGPWV